MARYHHYIIQNTTEVILIFQLIGVTSSNDSNGIAIDPLMFSMEFKDDDLDTEFESNKLLNAKPEYTAKVKRGRPKKESSGPKSKAKRANTSSNIDKDEIKNDTNETKNDMDTQEMTIDKYNTNPEPDDSAAETKLDPETMMTVTPTASEKKQQKVSPDNSESPSSSIVDHNDKHNEAHELLLIEMNKRVQAILQSSKSKSDDEPTEGEKKKQSEKEKTVKEKPVKAKKEKVVVKGEKKEVKKKDMTMEGERERSIIHKPNLHTWTVNVEFFGRTRHIGIYSREVDANAAFDAAYQLRLELQPVYEVLDKKNKEHQLAYPLFIRRGMNYASEIDENLKVLDINNLKHEIGLMIFPIILAEKNFSWTPTEHDQFSYAFLVDRGYRVIRISCHRTTLGNIGENVLENLDSMGIPQTHSNFLGVYRYSMNPTDGEVIHVSKDKSIAIKHARILWNTQSGVFEIMALSNAGIFVDSVKYLPSDGCVELKSGSTIQVGHSINYFLIPGLHSNIITPIQRRITVVNDLIAYSKILVENRNKNAIKGEEMLDVTVDDDDGDEGDVEMDADDDSKNANDE